MRTSGKPLRHAFDAICINACIRSIPLNVQLFGECEKLPRIMSGKVMELNIPLGCLFKLNEDNVCICT